MEAKEKLFKVIDKIKDLKSIPESLITDNDKLELENLEVKKMQLWSDWKD